MSNMQPIDIARRMAELGQTEDACRAYELAISESAGKAPEIELEAALYILQSQGDYKVSYTCLCGLYNRGQFKEESLAVLTEAFYDPNQDEQKERYAANRALLAEYPHLPRKDFIPFDELTIRFYPYDDHGYIPFHRSEERFGDYTDFGGEITIQDLRYDVEKTVAVTDLYSQYGLEYLKNNIIPKISDRPNVFVCLRYTDWGVFCSHLQVLDLRPVLEGGRVIFLFGDDGAI